MHRDCARLPGARALLEVPAGATQDNDRSGAAVTYPVAPVPPTDPYSAATQNLRNSTKWLMTAAAAVAASLIAGLQLSDLGELGSDSLPRLVMSLAGLSLGLFAVGRMIWASSSLLIDEWITLAELALEDFEQQLNTSSTRADRRRASLVEAVIDDVETNREQLYGQAATSLDDLYRQLVEYNRLRRDESARGGTVTPTDGESVRPAIDPHQAAALVVSYANHRRTRQEFQRLRSTFTWWAVPAVVGVLVYAYGANPAASQEAASERSSMAEVCPFCRDTGPSSSP